MTLGWSMAGQCAEGKELQENTTKYHTSTNNQKAPYKALKFALVFDHWTAPGCMTSEGEWVMDLDMVLNRAMAAVRPELKSARPLRDW